MTQIPGWCDYSHRARYLGVQSQVGHRNEKGQFSFQSQRKAMPKNAQTTTHLHSFHTSKVMLKILQARLQQYMNRELQAGFRKGREPEIKLPTSAGS